MENIQYIMVTNWKGHWDHFWSPIEGAQSTLFTHGVIKDDSLKKSPWFNKAKTLFIKLDDGNKFEKAWIGISDNFRKESYKGKPAVRFEVSDLQMVDYSPEFKKYTNGWHLNKSSASVLVSSKENPSPNENLQPTFFKEMESCDAMTFELNCFRLLRLLGIHDIHKFPQDDNRGKADGFFCFNTLSVIYDATLETNYLRKKETQIENYVNQLKKEKIPFGTNSYTIKGMQRQVWIITRGNSVLQIRNEDQIKVKEIPYSKLIEVYHQRLNKEIISDELWDILKDLN